MISGRKVVWHLLIHPSMGNGILVNPIFLFPYYTFVIRGTPYTIPEISKR
jgi:hypothetical protein